jgi:DnaJ-class molecular chaperone
MKDYYSVLGVSPSASAREIQNAHRRIAVANHPDTHSGDPEALKRFQAATAAYNVLYNAERRADYDRKVAAIASVQDFFGRRERGRILLETVLPAAPAAQQRGADECLVVEARLALLRNGGELNISVRKSGSPDLRELIVKVPPGAEAAPWCRLENGGATGKNGAPNGDMYVFFLPQSQTTKRRRS